MSAPGQREQGQIQGRAVDNKRAAERKPTILLAEDSPADVYLIREALREHGVESPVRVAPDGKHVLQLLSDPSAKIEDVGLIILDLNLPLHDGIEILQQLRTSGNLARIPVVVLTSSDSPRDRLMAGELGAACYLRKPTGLDQFLSLGAIFKNLLESRAVSGEQ